MQTKVYFNYIPDEKRFALNWVGSHPGDATEQDLTTYYETLLATTERADEIIIVNNLLIYTYYVPSTKVGISYISDQQFDPTSFYNWFAIIINFKDLHPQTLEEILEVLIRTFTIDYSLTILSPDYLQSVFDSSEATYTFYDPEDLMNIVWTILNLRPWYILFADQFIIKFNVNTIREVMSPNYLRNQTKLDLEFIEQKLAIGDTEYQQYLYKVIQFCIGLEDQQRMDKFTAYANLLNKINEDQDIYVQIQTLGEYIFDFISLDVDFALLKIQNVINRISMIADLTKDQILNLLNLSEALTSINNPEMAKLAEGTAFELTLKLSDYSAKTVLFSRFATIALKGGINDVANFIEMLSAFLSPDPRDIKLFDTVLAIVEPTLEGSNIGLYSLLGAYLTLEQPIKAITIKFQLAHQLTLADEIGIELLESIIWVLQLPGGLSPENKDILTTEFAIAIQKSPPGEQFLSRIKNIYALLLSTKNTLLSVSLTTVILKNFEYVASLDRFELLQIINDHLSNFPVLAELQSIIHAKLFAVALEEELTDKLDDLFEKSFSNIQSDMPDFKEHFLKVIGRMITPCLQHNSMVYFIRTIEHLLQQSANFNMQFVENGIAGVLQIILNIIERSSPTNVQIHPDIAISASTYLLHVIEEHGLNLSIEKSIYPLLDFVLQAEKYDEYSTLLKKLYETIRLSDPTWPDIINHYATQLMQQQQTKITRELYDYLLEQNQTSPYEAQLIRQQLAFTQHFDSSYYDSNELLANTLKLISLSQTTAEPAEIFRLFQTSLDELQSYGNSQTVLDLCIEVFNYASDVDDYSKLRLFVLQYLGNFEDYLTTGDITKVSYYLRYPLNILPLTNFKVELYSLLDKYVQYALATPDSNKKETLLYIREFALQYFPTPESDELQEYRTEFFASYETTLSAMHSIKPDLNEQLIMYSQLLEIARILNYKDQIVARLSKILSSLNRDAPLLPLLFLIASTASLLDAVLYPDLDAILGAKAIALLELIANLYKNLPEYSTKINKLRIALQSRSIQVTALSFEVNQLVSLYDSLTQF